LTLAFQCTYIRIESTPLPHSDIWWEGMTSYLPKVIIVNFDVVQGSMGMFHKMPMPSCDAILRVEGKKFYKGIGRMSKAM